MPCLHNRVLYRHKMGKEMSKICVCVLTENNFQDKTEEKGAEHSLGTVPLRGWGGVGGDMYRNVYLCACVIKQWNNAPLNLSQ